MRRGCGLGPWVLAVGALTGCVSENSPWMRTGEDCLSCHSAGGRAAGKPWSAAGTLYTDAAGSSPMQGAKVLIVDARGVSVTLTSNESGNFYTGEDLQAPFQYVAVDNNGKVTQMVTPSLPTGACNSCHSPGNTAQLRIFVP
jgi:hypothetical protein